MKRIEIGCPEVSPKGGYRKTFLELPEDQPESLRTENLGAIELELQLGPISGVSGYRIVQEEEDGSVVQEYRMAPDVMYDLFLELSKIDKDAFPDGNPHID